MQMFNFFKKGRNVSSAPLHGERQEALSQVAPPLDLFIDNEPPKVDNKDSEKRPKIAVFLDQDYYGMGKREGFEYHSEESNNAGKRRICANFRLIVDHVIQEREEQASQLNNQLAGLGNMHAATTAQLQNKVQEVKSSIEELKKQKELSVELEGWVMSAVLSYQQGFLHGLNHYFNTEALLGSIKNI